MKPMPSASGRNAEKRGRDREHIRSKMTCLTNAAFAGMTEAAFDMQSWNANHGTSPESR